MAAAPGHAQHRHRGFDGFGTEASVHQDLDALGPRLRRGLWYSMLDADHVVGVGVVAQEFDGVTDLHRERGTGKLEFMTEYGDYMVRFPDTQRRSTDQLLSVVVGVVIVATFTGLFGYKWLGWFF